MQNDILKHSKLAILGTALSIISINQAQCAEGNQPNKEYSKTLTEALSKLQLKDITAYENNIKVSGPLKNCSEVKKLIEAIKAYLNKNDKANKKELVTAYKKLQTKDAKMQKSPVYTELVKTLNGQSVTTLPQLLTNDKGLLSSIYDSQIMNRNEVDESIKIEIPDDIIEIEELNPVEVEIDTDNNNKQMSAIMKAIALTDPAATKYLKETLKIATDTPIGDGISSIQASLNAGELTKTKINELQTSLNGLQINDKDAILKALVQGSKLPQVDKAVQILKNKNITLKPNESSLKQITDALTEKELKSVSGIKRTQDQLKFITEAYKTLKASGALKRDVQAQDITFANQKASEYVSELTQQELKEIADDMKTKTIKLTNATKELAQLQKEIQEKDKTQKSDEQRIKELESAATASKDKIKDMEEKLNAINSAYDDNKDEIIEMYNEDKSATLAGILYTIAGSPAIVIPDNPDGVRMTCDEAKQTILAAYKGESATHNEITNDDIIASTIYKQLQLEKEQLETKYKKLEQTSKDAQKLITQNEALTQENVELKNKIKTIGDPTNLQAKIAEIKTALKKVLDENPHNTTIKTALTPLLQTVAAISIPTLK